MDVPIMNLEQRHEVSDDATMTKEMRKEIKETFKALEEMLLQASSAESIIATHKLVELLAKAKDYLHALDEKWLEISRNDDFRFEIAKAIEAVEICQSEVKQGRDGDEWLKAARERIRGINDRLKGW